MITGENHQAGYEGISTTFKGITGINASYDIFNLLTLELALTEQGKQFTSIDTTLQDPTTEVYYELCKKGKSKRKKQRLENKKRMRKRRDKQNNG